VNTIESLLHRRTDLSAFVVHFTRESHSFSAEDNLLSILGGRHIEARTVYGMAKGLAKEVTEIEDAQRVACFTETPLEHAWMMCSSIEGRSVEFNGYGLAFTRTYARRKGANPVWYLDITPGHDWLTVPIANLVEEARRNAMPFGNDPTGVAKLLSAPILRLTPFIEQMGQPVDVRKEFWWEREWRHVGTFNFEFPDIVVVFAPEARHSALRESIKGCLDWNDKMPTLVDVNWGLERMIGAFADVPDLDPFPK
jgi:hypothetical protein